MISVFLLAGCDPGISITYENRTDSKILVDVRSNEHAVPVFDEVEAGATITIDYLADDRYEITIVNEDGDILFHEVFAEEELEGRGNRIVIEEPDTGGP